MENTDIVKFDFRKEYDKVNEVLIEGPNGENRCWVENVKQYAENGEVVENVFEGETKSSLNDIDGNYIPPSSSVVFKEKHVVKVNM